MNYQIAQQADKIIRLKVVGVGGAGGHVVNRMDKMKIPYVQYAAINTDAKAICASEAGERLLIGKELMQGLGTGGDTEIGKRAAEMSQSQIDGLFRGCDMVFLTAGLGGGVGTGALPVAAKLAKAQGILTIAVVTLPFYFEGQVRQQQAKTGLSALKETVDALIVLPNDNLRHTVTEKLTLTNAFDIADGVLTQTVGNMIDLIQRPAYINTEFSDVAMILRNAGAMHAAFTRTSGINRAEAALKELSYNTLLGTSIQGAKGILLCVTASSEISLGEIEALSDGIRKVAADDANIIFGMDFNETLGNSIQAMLLANGMEKEKER